MIEKQGSTRHHLDDESGPTGPTTDRIHVPGEPMENPVFVVWEARNQR